jgi:membrane-bound lytic murein transglycosylase D
MTLKGIIYLKLKQSTCSFLLAGTILFSSNTAAQVQKDTNVVILHDDPIAAMLDSLAYVRLFQPSKLTGEMKGINLSGLPSDSVPIFDAKIIADRIARLDAISPFKMVYNAEVKGYIDMYANRKRNQVARMMGLSYLYFPMFEELLAKHKMPLELKYLAIVESALNPNARSRAGAVGLWQFMYGTGKMFNLNVNSYIDERSDPYKSTEAACLYLKYLYSIYKDWSLALAAYNSGPGNVNKAIRRSGGKTNYWDLRPYMPKETAGYVPAFIAASYVMHYAKEHNLHPIMPRSTFFDVDTVHVRERITFLQLSSALGMSIEDIQFLNPSYILKEIPRTETYHILTLPKDKAALFVNNESLMSSYMPSREFVDSLSAINSAVDLERKTHIVKSGENITSLARRYRVSVADIKRWNNLNSNTLNKGQRLVIESPYKTPAAAGQSKTTSSNPEKPITPETKNETSATTIHVVKAGDTMWKVATKYGMTVNELKELNKMQNTALKVGQKLKVKQK